MENNQINTNGATMNNEQMNGGYNQPMNNEQMNGGASMSGYGQPMNNLPPNVGGINQGSGFSLKNVFGVIDKFTKDIDKIVTGIGDSIESALNGSSVNQGINNINQTLDRVQQPLSGQVQMPTYQPQSNDGNIGGKVIEPVIGRSSIVLSNGNEVSKLPETPDGLPSEFGYLSELHDTNGSNMGQMVTTEIHSILDKKEDMKEHTQGVSLTKSDDKNVDTVSSDDNYYDLSVFEHDIDRSDEVLEDDKAIEDNNVDNTNTSSDTMKDDNIPITDFENSDTIMGDCTNYSALENLEEAITQKVSLDKKEDETK